MRLWRMHLKAAVLPLIPNVMPVSNGSDILNGSQGGQFGIDTVVNRGCGTRIRLRGAIYSFNSD